MKKTFGLLLMSLAMLLPLNVKAAIGAQVKCGEIDDNNHITCTVTYNITDVDSMNEVEVKMTEKGGAQVTAVENVAGSEWSIESQSEDEATGVWTIKLTAPDVTGEGSLFQFTYTPSGLTGCGIDIELEGKTTTITPDPTPTPDEPTDNKQTGTSLPYIALGTMVVIATGAYLATRNKTKMYKI